ncbi:glycosyltransferase family 9 protein [Pectinatus frisingensis]|uniref:glycosyltransferase family 9 protein n=1 Tax=Pectinatus frisingensis TaxID=865 RepID=UPI0018C53488|nr:glycosyltransferase family 9 protein [Pectinatus frisingensis]
MEKKSGSVVYKNILVLNLRKIGDTIMATAAAYLLKKAYPDAKVTMLVKPLTRTIVENNPVIDEVLLYNYSHKAKISEIQQTAGLLKSRQFDLAVVIDGKPRSAILAYLAGIPNRIGFENVTLRNIYLRLFYTQIYDIDYDFAATQQVKNHEIFINRITKRNDTARMIMPEVPEADKRTIDELLSGFPADKFKIALCIRSGIAYKDWPQDRFIKTVQGLSQEHNNAVFYTVGSNNDYTYAQEFIRKSDMNIKNLCGRTNLPQLGYLLQKTDFLLSVDTGTAHIAAAVNTKEVVVFAGTSHRHWAPYGGNVAVVYPDISCYPCKDKVRRKCTDYPCLQNVSVNQVITACDKVLADMEGT